MSVSVQNIDSWGNHWQKVWRISSQSTTQTHTSNWQIALDLLSTPNTASVYTLSQLKTEELTITINGNRIIIKPKLIEKIFQISDISIDLIVNSNNPLYNNNSAIYSPSFSSFPDPYQGVDPTNNDIWITNNENVSLNIPKYSKIGIGVLSPKNTLDVVGLTTIKASESQGDDVLRLYSPTLIAGKEHYLFFANRFYTPNSSEMYSTIGAWQQNPDNIFDENPSHLILQNQIDVRGNVGIGRHTAPPVYKLSVMGTGYFSGAVRMNNKLDIGTVTGVDIAKNKLNVRGTTYMQSGWGNWLELGNTINNEFWAMHNPQSQDRLEFYYRNNDGSSIFNILELHRNGDVRVARRFAARSVHVNTNAAFPDYVFKEDYNLMPLELVEEYINKNHHLPEVPAGEILEKEGMDVSEMLLLHMRKIEELTLYLLEVKKENKELKQMLDTLKQ